MAKESFYFSHDYGSRNDPKLVKVLMKLGQEGKGVYWDLIEMLYEQGGYLMLSDCDSYAFALRTEEACITKLVNDFGLFENDGERFWSNSVLSRMDKRETKSQKAKESALKRWNKADSNSNASKTNANALRTKSEPNAIKERKEKESKINIEEIDKEDTPASPAPYVFTKKFDSMEEVLKSIKDDKGSLDEIGMIARISDPSTVTDFLDEFFRYQKSVERSHDSRPEFKKHFYSWYASRYPNNGVGKSGGDSTKPTRDGFNEKEQIGKWIWLNKGWRDTSIFTMDQKRRNGLT